LAGQPLLSNSIAALPTVDGEVLFLTYDSLIGIGLKRLAYGTDHTGAVSGDYFYIPNALGQYSVKEFKITKFPEYRSLGFKHTISGILMVDNLLFFMERGTHGKLFHLKTGKVIWEKQFQETSLGEPVLAEDVLFLAFINGVVVAVDWQDGRIIWEKDLGVIIRNNPLVVGEQVFVFSKEGDWMALSTKNGEVLWQKKTAPVVAPPASDGELIFIASTNNNLYAFHPGTHQVEWVFSSEGVLTDQPFVLKSHVLIGSWDKNVYVINKKTGKSEFAETFKKPVKKGLLYINGKLYINVANLGTYIYETVE